jgi:hypothetical protein
MMAMRRQRTRVIVVFVCIAVFAVTAMATAPMLAVLDAQTPIDALFWSPASAPIPALEDSALPAAPVVDRRASRAPPIA